MSPPREEAASPQAPHLDGRSLDDRIFIYSHERLVRVFLRDIKYIEAQRAYCKVVTAKREYLLSMSLGALERQLPGHALLRVHRSYLVNLSWVEELSSTSLSIGSRTIPVARSRWGELRQYIRFID